LSAPHPRCSSKVAEMSARIAIKVDVDTYIGLRQGVPALLRIFERLQVPASFFVSCGPDHSGRAIRRLLRPGFLRKMRRTNALSTYGWRTVLYGTLLPGPRIAQSFPDLLRAAEAAGHEVGVHGYDHVLWQDRLTRMSLAHVRAELRRGLEVYQEILGHPARSFAAPGWQCSARSLACEDEAALLYHSDTRGSVPYLPRIGERVFRTPEIPSTWPTLDEVYGLESTEPAVLVRQYLARLRQGLNVHTIHAEVEGLALKSVFVDLVEALEGQVDFVRMDDEARKLRTTELPVHDVVARPVPGRHGTVATQA
jgi:undecaprenyl phosphate-alpha-L-ara4FN deformylase